MNVRVTKVGGRYAPKWSIEAAVPRKKVNGRKAWRRAAKKLRRKLREGAKEQIPLVEHLPEKLAKCIAKRMRRHGTIVAADDMETKLTTLFYVSFEEEIAGWEAEIEHRPKPFTTRSLVGMPQGARKRRWAKDYDALPQSGRASKTVSMLRAYGVYPKEGNPLAQRLRPCPGCCACWGCEQDPTRINPLSGNTLHWAGPVRKQTFECPMGPPVAGKSKLQIARMRKWQDILPNDCDGSGVLQARRGKR